MSAFLTKLKHLILPLRIRNSFQVNCEQSDKHERDVEEYDFEDTPEWDFYGRIGEGGCLDGMFVRKWDIVCFFVKDLQ